ncbi:TIGR00180 family glycosyltransferase [Oceanibaculum pacificum]|uniref:Glycosyltransferase 2-like domain-containing protein n=1 Tax=Oceanibaculum pacificum TaxID=580166 RepID=A0A154WFG6_9PROT|nr:TIGR00180 family glycosyltransferase [Oceanibaculum pacificum]KZD12205.1 hypothetical protein AUP43_05210 [Oceanibaculum pacificum]
MRAAAQDLTLILPTYNRAHFLARFFDYARASGFDMPILVADGSEAPGAEANAAIIARHAEGLTVRHQRYDSSVTPGLRVGMALMTLETTYCLMCADDDFVFPSKVREAVACLEADPDAVACGGPMIVFTANPAKGPALRVHVSHDVQGPTALQRIDAHMTQYRPTFYSVYRTAAIRTAYGEGVQAFNFWPRLAELVLSSSLLAQGGYRALDGFYGMREMHPTQESKTGAQWLDMIIDPAFSTHLDVAAGLVADLAAPRDGVSRQVALDAVKLSFFRFIHANYGKVLRGNPSARVLERHGRQRDALQPILAAPPEEIAAALISVGARQPMAVDAGQ